jgi:NAD(P)-dependent dehydrogenase (short-subunit alcohol dehydrogenase family)
MSDLQGRVVLVTGGGRGLGRSFALAFGREGARVALAARTARQLESVAEEVRALGGEAIAIPTDVTDAAQIDECVARTRGAFGPVDVAICNAGMNVRGPVVGLSPADWDRVQDTSPRATFLLARAVLPDMLARSDGQIFTVASAVGRRPRGGIAAYATAKAAVIAFSHALAAEVKEQGVRVTCVIPGTLNTPWFDDRPEMDRETMLDPDEVARAVVQVAKLDRAALVPDITIMPCREETWP